MFVVWKYTLPVDDEQWIEMPADAEILFVASQRGEISFVSLWAKVDPSRPRVSRRILICGTGHPVAADAAYIGSVIVANGDIVWHVFDGHEEGAVQV